MVFSQNLGPLVRPYKNIHKGSQLITTYVQLCSTFDSAMQRMEWLVRNWYNFIIILKFQISKYLYILIVIFFRISTTI
jgi:hypothetical protein